MTTFLERLAEDRRLVILRLLAEANSEANESLLALALSDYGHRVSRDQTRTDLAWLREQGLVEIEDLGGLMIARLTQRGFEASSGIITVPGVRRPTPKG
jgi:DNA-binding transcriptional ArsR family regulator